jgi:ribonuclease P protein component
VVVHLTLPSPEEEDVPRVGFVVSKKIGNSVIRHRVTRRLREIVRPRLAALPAPSLVVIRALPGIDDVPFALLEQEVSSGLESAARKALRRTKPETRTRDPRRDHEARRHEHTRPVDPTLPVKEER